MKTLTRNWRNHRRTTGTHKHTETVSKYFDWHGRLSQSEESKCLWTHNKDGVPREFTKGAIYIDHVERKVPKYENHKLRERKVKTLTRNWSDHCRTGTQKHMETVSKYFDGHSRLSQSEESKCLWTHDKDGVS